MTGRRVIAPALLAAAVAGSVLTAAPQHATPGVGSANPRIRPIVNSARVGATAPELTAEIPAVIRQGEVVKVILHIRQDGHPVDGAPVCLAATPLFISVEDALDSTPAGGVDLGPATDVTAPSGCTMAIAGVPSGPGTYAFTWEPDTPGRVTLTFTGAGGRLVMPIDVASAPPNATVLVLFCVSIVGILGAASWIRRRQQVEGAR